MRFLCPLGGFCPLGGSLEAGRFGLTAGGLVFSDEGAHRRLVGFEFLPGWVHGIGGVKRLASEKYKIQFSFYPRYSTSFPSFFHIYPSLTVLILISVVKTELY